MRTRPMTTIVPSPLTPERARPFFERLDEDQADHRADDGAAAAEDRRAAENHRRDDVELDARAHVGARRRDARNEDHRGEPGTSPAPV